MVDHVGTGQTAARVLVHVLEETDRPIGAQVHP